VSATPSPSARRRPERRARLPRRLRRFLPRIFQGRLTGAFLAVVALTLLLVTAIVINRLDDYFTKQQQADLDQRSRSVDTYVEALAADAAKGSPVVGVDGQVDPAVLQAMSGHALQRFIADRLGQADVEITFGRYVSDGETERFVPALSPPIMIHLEASPEVGQTQEKDVGATQDYGAGETVFTQYAVRISLSNPYTFRATALANVTGLLAAVALFALALAIVALYYLVFIVGWIRILAAWGIVVPYRVALQAEMVSMLAKYVPGGVWTPAARVAVLMEERGMRFKPKDWTP